MSEALSSNTQAILLLTAPLIVGGGKRSNDLLSPGEYKKLALNLRELGQQPADLLSADAEPLLSDCQRVIERERLERLLARGFLLSQAVERWHARAIWVMSRADRSYPPRLKERLREDSPPVLYGCGEGKILDTGGLAVVGSRNADEDVLEFARRVSGLAARSRRTLISGGARGIDQTAMRGALDEGGRVAGVLADSLERTAMNREHRNLLMEGQLVLISPYDPGAAFNVGHAMQRNKVIYALADAALVVSADLEKGGTWAGATEQLDKLNLVPVYIRSTGEKSKALDALRKKGALPWPNPGDEDGFEAMLRTERREAPRSPVQADLSFAIRPPAAESDRVRDLPLQPTTATECDVARPTARALDASDELFAKVRELAVAITAEPRSTQEFASELGVTKRQAEEWLRRLVREGVLRKVGRPVRYAARRA